MATEVIQITDRERWLAERLKDVTSTEVSALYGLNPYRTEFELFHEKRDGVVVQIQPNERMTWGTRLEAAIAAGAAEDMGWTIEKLNVYMRDLDVRMGSSFDFEIKSSSDGPGLLEVKNVDALQYARNWIDDGNGNIEGPEHIELQIQHQMEVSGYAWCALVALVGGNEKKVVLRNRDRDIGADMRAKVSAFWARVNAGQAPNADYSRDAEFIIKQLRTQADSNEVLTADKDLDDMIREYHRISAEAADLEAIKSARRAEILQRIGKASKVVTSFGSLSCGNVNGRSGTLITPQMVGTVIGSTEGYRNFRIYTKKEK